MLLSELERIGRFPDPWREFERIDRVRSGLAPLSGREFPPINLWVAAESAVVTMEIPGIDPDAVDMQVVGSTLTVKGSRKPCEVKEGEAYHRRERWAGQFTRTVELPYVVETGKVDARVSKGVLTVVLPRAEADKPKKISVKTV
ncbi:MAG TPA: Hsp20/alpha crystallin family protein [Dissulfurispiraceae bacterium]|nr:Hsp20/alpha crystallin family protein [Dissulfurispiraceae bacterium]